jgi:hypothetical protein
MDLRSLINEITRQADDFLDGASSRREARAGIDERVNGDYPQLSPGEREQVAEAVMTILENEGFFEFGSSSAARDEFDADSTNNE